MAAHDQNWELQLRKGVTELYILAALQDNEAYGFELLQRLRKVDGMTVTEGTVYPLLARLLKAGALRQRSEKSKTGPPRRYYRLTARGKKRLQQMLEHFNLLHAGVNNLMHNDSVSN